MYNQSESVRGGDFPRLSRPVQPEIDAGLWCLGMIGRFHDIAVDAGRLQHQFNQRRFTTDLILRSAPLLGMRARVVRQPLDRLNKLALPAIGIDKEGCYFLIVRALRQLRVLPDQFDDRGKPRTETVQNFLVHRPGEESQLWGLDEFLLNCSGDVILFASKSTYAGAMARFDFTWFVPAIIRYRRLLIEVLLISFVLQVVALITPMFFQVVMDKVLVNHAMSTLNVISLGLAGVMVFEVLLGCLRTFIMAQTCSKIDVELGARLFRHLLALPIAYFHARRVGDSVARVRELESIRGFLTGQTLSVVLDITFSFVFLAVMLWYSITLTCVVLVSIPLYVLTSIVFTPLIRRRLDVKFQKGSESQSFLVESVSGIDTIKSLSVEPRWHENWEHKLAGSVSAGLAVTNAGALAGGIATTISKGVTVATLWIGASLVVEGNMTVGELVAFNMLASHVSDPILRLAQLWNDFQQVGVSMSRLGDILNTPTESAQSKTEMPRLQGSIEFDHVNFRYRPDASNVLEDVCLRFEPGEVIGIVGRSGSGKSTLTKLVQRLYVPMQGRVLIDGHNIAVADVVSLRQQAGVVLQENTLFERSVRANIALANPSASIDAVMEVAKLAGAHEFICELPEGYDTLVGENGTGLSGGQRQRIAIARALLTNPRILIFDEATSALDYESEKVIQDNMRSICAGRTVLIIAHRLSAVRDAHRIVVMEAGRVVEVGRHDELLKNPDGIYTHLHRLQHT